MSKTYATLTLVILRRLAEGSLTLCQILLEQVERFFTSFRMTKEYEQYSISYSWYTMGR